MERLTKQIPGCPGEYQTRRIATAVDRLGDLEDKLERGELVEVVHGEWDYKTYDSAGNTLYRCSNCKNYAREKTYHCPDCGAKMDRKEQP